MSDFIKALEERIAEADGSFVVSVSDAQAMLERLKYQTAQHAEWREWGTQQQGLFFAEAANFARSNQQLIAAKAQLEATKRELENAQEEIARIKTPKDDEFDVYETFYIDAHEWLRPHIEAGKLPQSVIESVKYVIEFWEVAQKAAPVAAMPIQDDKNAG